jgi:hypothetical protein
VDHREGALELGVSQVGIEALELRGHEHALVDNGAAGKGVDVQLLQRETGGSGRGLDALARHVECALKGIPFLCPEPCEDLRNMGTGVLRQLAEELGIHRHLAPA